MLEGTASIADLVNRAVKYRMPWLALTDTDGLYGAIPFYQTARAAGIKPILGAHLGKAVVLARDQAGYAELCRMITAYQLGPEFRLVEWFPSDHLFAITSDEALIEALDQRDAAPLVAITHYGGSRSRYQAGRRYDFARDRGLRPVAVTPVYFMEAAHARIHHALSAIRLNTTVDRLPTDRIAPREAWFRSPEVMARLYADWPDTLINAQWVADRCNLELELGRPLFPTIALPADETPFSFLWKQAFQGVTHRYRPLTPEIIDRLRYELDIIRRLGFAPYFLIVWDIVRYARRHEIPIVGRGSAANSLVAYALGITRADPIRYNLYFERFLNLSRTDCPDIDLDICWRQRDTVVDYVYERYGRDRVAMIASFNTFQARGALREVAKAFGMTDREIGPIVQRLPHYRAEDIPKVVEHLPECRGIRFDTEPLKSVLEVARFIDGFPRHLSLHPCGLVIAPEPLTQFAPLQRAAKGLAVTQYDMHPIEDLGLVKMDLLGHRSLTVIDQAIRMIRENRQLAIDIERIPDPDPLTARLIRAGDTIGCFQIESPAMRALLQNLRADNTDMLIKTLSLVRPGPSGSGMKRKFIQRHLGKEETVYLHPALESVLGDTYGVMLYQEDTLKVASVIAGMNLAEADTLRRAMSKKRLPGDMAQSMKDFIEKASANGVASEVAEAIWALMANFAEYAYCKAHASTYGELAYQCAYLKAHFPAEFLATVLSNRGGFYHTAVYLEELRRHGIEVRPPDINASAFDYTVENEAVRVGFVEIQGLGQAAVEAILDRREQGSFRDLSDLAERTGISCAQLERLIQAGACDGFGLTRPQLLWELEARKRIEAPRPTETAPELLLEHTPRLYAPRLPDYSRKRRIDLEWEACGMPISTHPLAYYVPEFAHRALVLSVDLPRYAGKRVTTIGWLIAERRVGLKQRGAMKFLTLEDPAGVFEAVLFPRVYQQYGHLLTSHGPYLVTGEVQYEDHYASIIAECVERVGQKCRSWGNAQGAHLDHTAKPGANGRQSRTFPSCGIPERVGLREDRVGHDTDCAQDEQRDA